MIGKIDRSVRVSQTVAPGIKIMGFRFRESEIDFIKKRP